MMALLLVGCATPTVQTGERPEPQASPPVVRGCEVGQHLAVGESCIWAIPDGTIFVRSPDGHHLDVMMVAPGPCAIPWTRTKPYESWSYPSIAPGVCNRIFHLEDRRLFVGEVMRESRELMTRGVEPEDMMDRGMAAVMKQSMAVLAFGEHGWTIVQAPSMTP